VAFAHGLGPLIGPLIEPDLAPADVAPLARRDPRSRILLACGFALTVVSLDSPLAAAAALPLGAALAFFGGLGIGSLLRRIAALQLLLLAVLLTLPFATPGAPAFYLGPIAASREGLVTALLIALKANAVLLAMLGLLGGMAAAQLGQALARLGAPARLAWLLMLTLGQIQLLERERQRLQRAVRARAFVPRANLHTWRSLGQMVGMLLIRALERAERLRAAMRCRGFDGELRPLHRSDWRAADTALLMTGVVLLWLLVSLNIVT
jgi:cobalt/nickel transport system permease protein